MSARDSKAKQKKASNHKPLANEPLNDDTSDGTEQQEGEDLALSDSHLSSLDSAIDHEEQSSDSDDVAANDDEIDNNEPEDDEAIEDEAADVGADGDEADGNEVERDEADADEATADEDDANEDEDGEAEVDEDHGKFDIEALQQVISTIPKKPSSKGVKKGAAFVANWYSYLLGLSKADQDEYPEASPSNILGQLSCIAELWKKLLQKHGYDNPALQKAIANKGRIGKLCRRLEDEYTDVFAKHMIQEAKAISHSQQQQPDTAKDLDFARLREQFDVVLGSPVTIASNIDPRWLVSLVPNFHDASRYSTLQRVDRTYHNYKLSRCYHTKDEIALLSYLIWRNLRNLWVLVEWHDVDISANQISLENHFFSTAPVNDIFRRVTNFPDFMNPGAVEDAVACYSQFIDCELQKLNDQSLQSQVLAATKPLKQKVVDQFLKGSVLSNWDTNTVPALRLATLRLNHLNGGPLQIQRDTSLKDLWNNDDNAQQDDDAEQDGNAEQEQDSEHGDDVFKEDGAKQDEMVDDDMPLHDINNQIPIAAGKNDNARIVIFDGADIDMTGYPALQGRNVALANDYVFHPFPENRANEVAQSRLIERDLREPGIKSDGLFTEDCVNLPPPHCRPPGTYTGHKKRDPRGPYDVLKALSAQLIKSILQRPRRVRQLPVTRPTVTSRAACRSRKILKDAIRQQNSALAPRRTSTSKVVKPRPTALKRGLGWSQRTTDVPGFSSKRYGSTDIPPFNNNFPTSLNGERLLFDGVGNGPSQNHKHQGVQASVGQGGNEGASGQVHKSRSHAPPSYTPNNGPMSGPSSRPGQPSVRKSPTPEGRTSLHPRDYDAHDAQDIADGKVENVAPEVLRNFEAWQASFPDEEVGPEQTRAMQAHLSENGRNNNRIDNRPQLPEDLHRAANDNVEQTSRPKPGPRKTPPPKTPPPKAQTPEAPTPKAPTPQTPPQKTPAPVTPSPKTPPKPTKKVGKTKKEPKIADKGLQTPKLSPKDISKRTRAQRKNIQPETEDQDDDSDDGPASKKAKSGDDGKAEKKKTNKKPSKITGAAKDNPYKPQKGDDDTDGSDGAHPDGGKAAASGKKPTGIQKSTTKGKPKAAQPAPSKTKTGKKKASETTKPDKKPLKRARDEDEEGKGEGDNVVENPPKRQKDAGKAPKPKKAAS